jgi:hypothetical protein
MSTITAALAEVLDAVQRPGDFYATGTAEVFAPGLVVEGVGPIALPLLPQQAAQLVAAAERAPYGRGEETLVDTEVRRVWQIDAARVAIRGRGWARSLEEIVARAAEGLGVSEPVEAEFYKLLVYDEGSFFVSHRDTEKAPGMFATLVVVLPSEHTGGELILRHRDREVSLDLHPTEPSEVSFAAFYADCVHEVRPVRSGYRLTLVYTLLRRGDGSRASAPLPEPPSYDAEQDRLTALLRRWAAGKGQPDDDTPEKLIYLLEHAYTPAELSFAALKGADSAAGALLTAAAGDAACDLHLALLSIEESGAAEHTGGYSYGRSRRRWYEDEGDDEDYDIVEVSERTATLSTWRRPDGGQTELGDLPFEDTEVSPPDALQDMEPDEQYFHEATGNEGASFSRTYSRAAFVLWPRARRLAVFNQGGLPVTLPYLGELAGRWVASGAGPESPVWQEAHELSGHMLRTWPRPAWYPRYGETPSSAAPMLDALMRLRDVERIDGFLAGVSAAGNYGKGDNEALLAAARLLPLPRAAELIDRIIAANAQEAIGACADLLSRAASAASADGRARDLLPAANTLLAALPGDPAREPQPAAGTWYPAMRYARTVDPQVVVDTLSALGRIDPTLADAAAGYMLAWPKTYDLDAVLIPALRRLHDRPAIWDLPAVRRLRDAGLEHLRARIAEPLEPPRDWARASTLTHTCALCTELSQFLADPTRETWSIKTAEANRSHLESIIHASQSDLDVTIEQRGRPYTLVATKNQASYDRRASQRKTDLADAALLER